MKTQKLLVSFVALAVLAVFMASGASAFATFNKVTVNGIENFGDNTVASVFAGETVPVRVVFTSTDDAKDVRVTARLIGAGGLSVVSNKFNVVQGGQYSPLLNIKMPSDIDPSEDLVLEITVEGKRIIGSRDDENGNDDTHTEVAFTKDINLEVQRESYFVDILSADSNQDQIEAGKILALDVVLKNRGYEFAKDVYLKASIPELGITSNVYYGDLSYLDNADVNRDDAVQRRVYLNIPANAPAGLYTVQLEAYNKDFSTTQTKKIVIGSGAQDQVVSSVSSKTFATGEKAQYSVTIVNSGNTIKVYDVIVDAPAGITVSADQSLVVVPAGSSKTVTLTADASKEGNYNFVVNVNSDGQLVSQRTLAAVVQGTSAGVNPSVVLTVVLAVIFVVLVVVLIVLLTRKPQKTEEFGESYY